MLELSPIEDGLRQDGQESPIIYLTHREDGELVVLFTIPGLTRDVRVARTAYLTNGLVTRIVDGFEA